MIYFTLSTFETAVEFLSKLILKSDSIFSRIRNHNTLIAKILNFLINTFLLVKKDAFFGDYVLNFIKLDTFTTKTVKRSKAKSFMLIFIELVMPI